MSRLLSIQNYLFSLVFLVYAIALFFVDTLRTFFDSIFNLIISTFTDVRQSKIHSTIAKVLQNIRPIAKIN